MADKPSAPPTDSGGNTGQNKPSAVARAAGQPALPADVDTISLSGSPGPAGQTQPATDTPTTPSGPSVTPGPVASASESARRPSSPAQPLPALSSTAEVLLRRTPMADPRIRDYAERLQKGIVKQHEDIRQLSEDNRQLSEENQRLATDNNTLDRENLDLRRLKDELEQQGYQETQEISQLREQVKELTKGNKELKRDSNKLHKTNEEHLKQNMEILEEKAKLHQAFEQQNKLITKLYQDLNHYYNSDRPAAHGPPPNPGGLAEPPRGRKQVRERRSPHGRNASYEYRYGHIPLRDRDLMPARDFHDYPPRHPRHLLDRARSRSPRRSPDDLGRRAFRDADRVLLGARHHSPPAHPLKRLRNAVPPPHLGNHRVERDNPQANARALPINTGPRQPPANGTNGGQEHARRLVCLQCHKAMANTGCDGKVPCNRCTSNGLTCTFARCVSFKRGHCGYGRCRLVHEEVGFPEP